jgi:hypothetical protein
MARQYDYQEPDWSGTSNYLDELQNRLAQALIPTQATTQEQQPGFMQWIMDKIVPNYNDIPSLEQTAASINPEDLMGLAGGGGFAGAVRKAMGGAMGPWQKIPGMNNIDWQRQIAQLKAAMGDMFDAPPTTLFTKAPTIGDGVIANPRFAPKITQSEAEALRAQNMQAGRQSAGGREVGSYDDAAVQQILGGGRPAPASPIQQGYEFSQAAPAQATQQTGSMPGRFATPSHRPQPPNIAPSAAELASANPSAQPMGSPELASSWSNMDVREALGWVLNKFLQSQGLGDVVAGRTPALQEIGKRVGESIPQQEAALQGLREAMSKSLWGVLPSLGLGAGLLAAQPEWLQTGGSELQPWQRFKEAIGSSSTPKWIEQLGKQGEYGQVAQAGPVGVKDDMRTQRANTPAPAYDVEAERRRLEEEALQALQYFQRR